MAASGSFERAVECPYSHTISLAIGMRLDNGRQVRLAAMQPLPGRSSQALGGPLAPLTLAAAHRATASEAPNWVSVKGLKRMDRARLRTASEIGRASCRERV